MSNLPNEIKTPQAPIIIMNTKIITKTTIKTETTTTTPTTTVTATKIQTTNKQLPNILNMVSQYLVEENLVTT